MHVSQTIKDIDRKTYGGGGPPGCWLLLFHILRYRGDLQDVGSQNSKGKTMVRALQSLALIAVQLGHCRCLKTHFT